MIGQMIKAIILDCFGVLTTDKWHDFKELHFQEGGEGLNEVNALNYQADSGEISYESFLEKASALMNVDPGTVKDSIENNKTNDELLGLLSVAYKGKYKIGLLSNAPVNWTNAIFSPNQQALFDQVVLSCEVGVAKPDPAIFKIILAKFGVEPYQALYIDDQLVNCAAAESLGFKVIRYTDNNSLRDKMTELKL